MNDRLFLTGIAIFAFAFAIQGPILVKGLRSGELPMPLFGPIRKDKHPDIFWFGIISIISCFLFGAWFIFWGLIS